MTDNGSVFIGVIIGLAIGIIIGGAFFSKNLLKYKYVEDKLYVECKIDKRDYAYYKVDLGNIYEIKECMDINIGD